MNKENNIKIGADTSNLLLALRAIESARNFYFLAMEELRGSSEESDPMTPEEHATFDKARDLVYKVIGDNVMSWANCTDPNGEL